MKWEDRHISDRKIPFIQKQKVLSFKLFLFLGLIGSSIIYLFLLLSCLLSIINGDYGQFKIPPIFIINTFVLLGTSVIIHRTLPNFDKENIVGLKNNLLVTFIGGVIFVVFQIIGSLFIINQGALFNDQPGSIYIYIITGWHLLHCLAGIIYLGILYFQVVVTSKDIVKKLVFFSNPFQKMKMELAMIFWYFLDITWIVSFLYFLLLF